MNQKKYLSLQLEKRKMSDSTSRSGNDTLTVETGVRIPYPIPRRGIVEKQFLFPFKTLKIINIHQTNHIVFYYRYRLNHCFL